MIYTQLCFLFILQWLFVPWSLGSRNLALRKETTQSSTAHSGISGSAVDGNRNTHYFFRSGRNGQCTHTSQSLSPWWRVDLGQEFTVSYLTITNRGDCCSERLSNFEIRIGNSLTNNGNQNPKCGVTYSLKTAETRNISCPAMKGRYVNIRIPGPSNVLTLCEVEVYAEAQMFNPLGEITHWLSGSTVKLPWTIIYQKVDIVSSTLSFTKYGSGRSIVLARSLLGKNLTSLNSSYSTEGESTLVFQNANLAHNGTYLFHLSLQDRADGANTVTSNISVIILVQPIAQVRCSGIKDMMFLCECKSDIGNPPPLVYWTKDGKNIGDFGYRMQLLTIDNITNEEAAIYSCNVKSHNLTDQKNITFGKMKLSNDDNGCTCIRTKWYMFLITCICGIFIGATSLFVIERLHRKLRNRNISATISNAQEIPKMNHNGGGDDKISVYDELDLRTMNAPDNNYQSLTKRSGPTRNTEAKTDEHSVYEELNVNRENDENSYHSLNTVAPK